MAKSLNDILKGVKKSTIAPPDIDDKNLYQWNAPDGVKFIDKHKIEKHEDRVGNGDDVYTGKTKKTTKYKFQKDGVYEEVADENLDEKYTGFQKTKQALAAKGAKDPAALAAWIGRKKYGKKKFQAAAAAGKKLGEDSSCNHTTEGNMCEVHGKAACPTEDDVNMQSKAKKDAKGREYLADKKKCMEETITEKKNLKDIFKAASLAGALAASAHRMPGAAYDVATNVHHQDPGYAVGTVAANMHPASRVANALASALKADPAGKGEDEKERQKKYGKQLRVIVKEGIRSLRRKDPSVKDDPKKYAAEYPRTFRQPGVPSKAELRAQAAELSKGVKVTKIKEEQIDEVAPPDPKIEKWIKDNKARFIERYGKEKGMKVLYGRAWNMHGKTESGTATNTDYTGPGAAGWTTGRLDVGTL